MAKSRRVARIGPSQRRAGPCRWRSLLAAAVATVVLALLAAHLRAPAAQAHASLVRANPANNAEVLPSRVPARVALTFSEPIERDLTQIEVFDADDERVDEGDIAFDDRNAQFASVGLQGDIGPGAYFVRWSNVSKVDGHPYAGSYPFVVLNDDGSYPAGVTPGSLQASQGGTAALPKNTDIVLKWIAQVSLAIVAGAAFFFAAVLRPAARFLEEDQESDVVEKARGWLTNLAHVLLPVSFIAAAFLLLITVRRFETGTTLWSYVTDVRPGQYRAMLLGALVVALAGTDLMFLSRGRGLRNAGIALLMLASAVALFTYSMVSHSATEVGKFWSVSSDYLHLAGSAVWLGALVMLPFVLRARAIDDDARRFLFQANVFDRFSIAAGLSVALIIATGTFNALVEIPTWEALTDTTYGRVLLAKLALVVPLLAVAGLNAFILKPRLVRAIDETYQQSDVAPASPPGALSQLQRLLPRTIITEIALVIAVFASVAVLTQTATASGEIAQEEATRQAQAAYTSTQTTGDLQITLNVAPNLVGRNTFDVTVQRADGSAAETVNRVRLRFTYDTNPDLLPPSELLLNPAGPGEFRGESALFSQPGNWRLDVDLRRTDGDDVSRAFVLSVIRPAETTRDGDAFDLPFTSVTWNEVMGVALVLAGVLLVLYRGQLQWVAATARKVVLSLAAVLMIGGGVLAFGVDTHGETQDAREGNPVTPSEESVGRGRMLFEANCVSCHGVDGRGDGPAAASLSPPPSDYRQHVPVHTDRELFNFIANGYPMSEMPAFKDAFSEEDIWNLVNFLRAEFSSAPEE